MFDDRWSLGGNGLDCFKDPFLLIIFGGDGLKGLLIVDGMPLSVLVGIPHLSPSDELLEGFYLAS